VGPVVSEPFRSADDLAGLGHYDPAEHAPFVEEAIRMLVGELEVPLIGFAGAPFTLASYLVEGGPSRDHRRTKALMHEEPETWRKLLDRLADSTLAHLRAQVEAGAAAVQLFDSWAGTLEPADYEAHVLPVSRRIFEGLDDLGVPRIHFGVGTGELLPLMAQAGAEVVGVDWRVPLDAAWARVGDGRAVQGNLDPAACIGSWQTVERKTIEILRRVEGRPGHIFNLGHGVLPETPPDNLTRLVDLVHERTAR
jgi:uroporphyrinogen decarboxylase